MLIRYCLACLTFFLLAGCGVKTKELKTSRGFVYALHQDEPGSSPKIGEYVLFDIQLMHNNKVLTSSKRRNEKGIYKIRSIDKEDASIPLWADVFPYVSVGDSVCVYVPAESIGRLPGGVKKGDMLQYNIVLSDILNEDGYKEYKQDLERQKEEAKEKSIKKGTEIKNQTTALIEEYDKGQLGDKLINGKSGVQYIIHDSGDGATPKTRENIEVHYMGLLHSNGSVFNSSYQSGKPFVFPLGMGRVIQAWDETFPEFQEGTRATIFIPWELAYGMTGNPPLVPEKSNLVTYIHFLRVTSY